MFSNNTLRLEFIIVHSIYLLFHLGQDVGFIPPVFLGNDRHSDDFERAKSIAGDEVCRFIQSPVFFGQALLKICARVGKKFKISLNPRFVDAMRSFHAINCMGAPAPHARNMEAYKGKNFGKADLNPVTGESYDVDFTQDFVGGFHKVRCTAPGVPQEGPLEVYYNEKDSVSFNETKSQKIQRLFARVQWYKENPVFTPPPPGGGSIT